MIRIDTVFSGLPGMPGYNSLYFEGQGATLAAQAHDKVAGLWGTVSTSLHEDLAVTVTGEAFEVLETTGEIVDVHPVTPDNFVGADPLDLLPSATQLVVNFRTATVIRSRRARGKIFIPGLTEGNTDNTGAPLASAVTNFGLVVSTALGAGEPSHVVWSRPVLDAGGNVTTPGQAALVTSYAGMPQWAVLRTRRP